MPQSIAASQYVDNSTYSRETYKLLSRGHSASLKRTAPATEIEIDNYANVLTEHYFYRAYRWLPGLVADLNNPKTPFSPSLREECGVTEYMTTDVMLQQQLYDKLKPYDAVLARFKRELTRLNNREGVASVHLGFLKRGGDRWRFYNFAANKSPLGARCLSSLNNNERDHMLRPWANKVELTDDIFLDSMPVLFIKYKSTVNDYDIKAHLAHHFGDPYDDEVPMTVNVPEFSVSYHTLFMDPCDTGFYTKLLRAGFRLLYAVGGNRPSLADIHDMHFWLCRGKLSVGYFFHFLEFCSSVPASGLITADTNPGTASFSVNAHPHADVHARKGAKSLRAWVCLGDSAASLCSGMISCDLADAASAMVTFLKSTDRFGTMPNFDARLRREIPAFLHEFQRKRRLANKT